MRATTAYFAGVGTVAVAIAAGLGGGLLLGDIMSPQQPKHPSSEVTRLEQRSSQQPIQAINSASQPVPYLTAPYVNAAVAEPPASPPQAQPQIRQALTRPAEPATQPAASAAPRPVAATEQSAARERAARENSLAQARDAGSKRDARLAADRRKAERRQQWAEKRSWRQHKIDGLKDVEASVRKDSERRSFAGISEAGFEREEPRPLFGRRPFAGGGFSLFDD